MPTLAEYEAIFGAVTRLFEAIPYKNMREARHIVSLQNAACIAKRKELTQGITDAWKIGYAKLKAENDQMQVDLVKAFRREMQMNSEWLGDAAEGLQK